MSRPERIVSLLPSATEIVVAVGAGDRLGESAEILAAIVHPGSIPDVVARHGPGLRRITPEGESVAFR